MRAIKNKVIPVFYNKKSKKIYFDAIDDFNDENFRYLKKSKLKMTSHFIDLNVVESLNVREDKTNLEKLIIQLSNKVKNNELKMGIPLGLQVDEPIPDNLYVLNESEFRELSFIDENVETFDASSTSGGVVVSPHIATKTLVNVGQGLLFVDESQKLIYDAGGSFAFNKINYLFSGKYTIVISHLHHDHYKYIYDLIKLKYVKEIYIPENTVKTVSWEKILNLCKSSKTSLLFHSSLPPSFCGYNVSTFNVSGSKNLPANTDSCVLYSNEWILTGDQHTVNINGIFHTSVHFDNFLIPHHASNSTEQDPANLTNITFHQAYYSCAVGSHKGAMGTSVLSSPKYNPAGRAPIKA